MKNSILHTVFVHLSVLNSLFCMPASGARGCVGRCLRAPVARQRKGVQQSQAIKSELKLRPPGNSQDRRRVRPASAVLGVQRSRRHRNLGGRTFKCDILSGLPCISFRARLSSGGRACPRGQSSRTSARDLLFCLLHFLSVLGLLHPSSHATMRGWRYG